MSIEIKHRYTGETLYESEDATTIIEAVEEAVSRRADLGGVNLRDADLRGVYLRRVNLRTADLRGANLRRADLWRV